MTRARSAVLATLVLVMVVGGFAPVAVLAQENATATTTSTVTPQPSNATGNATNATTPTPEPSSDRDLLQQLVDLLGGGDDQSTPTPTPTPTPNVTSTATPAPTPEPTPTPTPTPEPNPNGTTVDTFRPPGPYSIDELRNEGTVPNPEGSPPASVRVIEGGGGAVAIRYIPVGPFTEDWEYMEPGTTIQSNKITVRSVRFGKNVQPKTFTLRIVYWQERSRTLTDENGSSTTVTYASNQTVKDHELELGRYYDLVNVSLLPHFERPWQVTMWLEKDGRRVPGAQWRFTHFSTQSGQPAGINSKGDLWSWVAVWVLLPGVFGTIGGFYGGKWTLRRTGTGPRLGLMLWGIIIAFAGGIALASWYFEIAIILDRAPWIMGASFILLSYGATLSHHASVRELLFLRLELRDALPFRGGARTDPDGDIQTPPDPQADGGQMAVEAKPDVDVSGDGQDAPEVDDLELGPGDYKEALYADTIELPTVYTEEGWKIPRPGIRPFLARLWANPAILDDSQIKANIKGRSGTFNRIILTDPESDEPVRHVPARLVWDPQMFKEPKGLSKIDPFYEAREKEQQRFSDWLSPLERVNWSFFGKAGIGAFIGWSIGSFFGLALLGGFLAVIGIIPAGLRADDGYIEFESAPVHFTSVLATITVLQREYDGAATIDQLTEQVWKERLESHRRAREELEKFDSTLVEDTFGPKGIRDIDEKPEGNFDFGDDDNLREEMEDDGK